MCLEWKESNVTKYCALISPLLAYLLAGSSYKNPRVQDLIPGSAGPRKSFDSGIHVLLCSSLNVGWQVGSATLPSASCKGLDTWWQQWDLQYGLMVIPGS